MGLQIVRFTKETTYNTFPTTPGAGTQQYFFIPVDDAVTILPEPQFFQIRDAGVGNRVIVQNVGRVNVGGDFQTYLFPSQMAYLKTLMDLVGTAPCLDVASFAVDRGIYLEDGACGRADRRYTGCKLGALTLSSDSTAQGSLFMLKGSVVGSTPRAITDTDLPVPALSAYPADDPYLFFQTAGKLTIGSARTNYQSLSLSVGNVLQPFPDESKFYGRIGWFGRTVTLTAKLLYKSNADRLSYEAGTKMDASLAIDNGITTTTFDLGGNALITSLSDSLPLGDYFTQTIAITALMDRTLGTPTDFTITVTTD